MVSTLLMAHSSISFLSHHPSLSSLLVSTLDCIQCPYKADDVNPCQFTNIGMSMCRNQ